MTSAAHYAIHAQSEKQFQDAVIEYAIRSGWRVSFIPDWVWRVVIDYIEEHPRKGREWSEPGFPDVLMVRPPRIVIAELKSQRGTVRPPQRAWLEDLAGTPVETFIWRPSMWDQIEETLNR